MSQALDICALGEIPNDSAKGFSIGGNNQQRHIFIIRKTSQIFAYENRCPHMGTSLDWQPDQFLDSENRLIQCSTHGALFRIEDGLCIYGPCVNQSLIPIPVEIQGDRVCILSS